MIATRVESISELWGEDGINGGYCSVILEDGRKSWMVRTPNGHMGNLGNHEVIEHEDGTITVSPSIAVSDNSGELYHGFLRRGVWESA
jgi:hypothetical protein